MASRQLSKQLGNAATITVIEPRSTFPFPPAYHQLILGRRRPRQIQRNLPTAGRRKNTRIINEKAEKIDVQKRTVSTRSHEVSFDKLVIAVGSELAPDKIEGLEEYAYNAYDFDGAIKLRDALQRFEGKRVVTGICRLPIKCPPAPYELALLLDNKLRPSRKTMDSQFFTPEVLPIPAAGAVVGKQVERLLTSRGIRFHMKMNLSRVEAGLAKFENGSEIPYDLLVAVPPHRCTRLVVEAGLTDSSGWVPVNPYNLTTKFEDVFAIGDVASIETPHGYAPFLPKAGVFAQGQAEVVANNIAVSVTGKGERKRWDGMGECFLEVDKGTSAFLRGSFLANPPRLEFHPPRRKWHLEKLRLEKKWMTERF